jgi:hypothetical protein
MKRQPINKDNYEEYFLLYVDNELTGAEKEEVERFVEQYPEMKQELQSFLDTRLDPEELRMEGSEELYRTEVGQIHAGNFEEYQLLLLDNELDGEKAKAIEQYNQSHEAAATNFEWLKKTKLPEEKIEFPDKSVLYRETAKPAIVMSISWWRYAAAAAVIFLAGLAWLNQDEENIPVNVPVAMVPQQPEKEDSAEPVGSAEKYGVQDQEAGNNANAIVETPPAEVGTSDREEPEAVKQKLKRNEGSEVPLHYADNRNERKIEITPANTTREIPEETVVMNRPREITETSSPAVEAVAMNVKMDYATQALTTGENFEETEDIYTNDSKQRKGLRGFVRKATRIYNKVTNPDLDKPLTKVANFEIGTPR